MGDRGQKREVPGNKPPWKIQMKINGASSEKNEKRMPMPPDSNEVHSPDNRVSSDKNNKRKLKTPAQLNALEKFYNEHQYPSEEMKSEVAERIELTEKQISSWFCHRRLKDKKPRDEPNGGQDRSGSIVRDHYSGLRPDSCGSSKQGDHQNIYHQEVQTSLYDHDRTNKYGGNVSDPDDDTSSNSSSSLQDKLLSPSEDTCGAETSRFITENNGAIRPSVDKGVDKVAFRPLGYLNIQGEIEYAAITAVRKQLGRLYRDDGPHLGVEFDPLPPGAFEPPTAEIVHTPIYVGDLARMRSLNVFGVMKQPRLRYGVYNSKMSPQGSYLEDANHDRKYGCDSYRRKSDCRIEQESAVDKFDDVAGEAIYSFGKKRKSNSKQKDESKRSDCVSDHPGRNGQELTGEMQPWSPDYPKKVRRKDTMSKPSSVMLESDKSLFRRERLPHTDKRIKKNVEKVHAEKKVKKRHPVNKPTVKKQSSVEFQEEENTYVGTTSLAYQQQQSTKPI